MTSTVRQFPMIDKSVPFDGAAHSTVTDGAGGLWVDYSGYLHNDKGVNLLFNEYRKLPQMKGKKLAVITWAEYDRLEGDYLANLKTIPIEITEEQFYEWLDCLPPCRWHNAGGCEVFHISERLTANLVQWCAKRDRKYYGFIQDATISDADILKLFNTKEV